jgi:hypothetical protein
MAGVLQVPTVEYLPFAFFNLINPLLAIVFGFTGFRVERQQPAELQGQESAGIPGQDRLTDGNRPQAPEKPPPGWPDQLPMAG